MKAYYNLMSLLNLALNSEELTREEIKENLDKLNIEESDWKELMDLATENSVTGLLYEILKDYNKIPEESFKDIERNTVRLCKRNYRYLVESVQINRLFRKADIPFCILKGLAAAEYYPIPDVRKSADLDILLTEPNDVNKVLNLLEKHGYDVEEEQIANHHVKLRNKDKYLLEVHTMLAEPFDNKKTNKFLEKLLPDCKNHIVTKSIMGVELPVLEDGYHAYELLMHMLQHFLRAGFGIKMLCDWVVFWNRGTDEKNREYYLKLVKDSKVKGFSDTITRVCVKYLGLKREAVCWMDLYDKNKSREEYDAEAESFVKEIMEAGEFGKGKDRMVAIRGDGLFDLVREFHHQMHLNFPRAGKCFLLWPVLWTITLIRFLNNNKKIRSVSSKEVFESARKRGKLVKSMHLFE